MVSQEIGNSRPPSRGGPSSVVPDTTGREEVSLVEATPVSLLCIPFLPIWFGGTDHARENETGAPVSPDRGRFHPELAGAQAAYNAIEARSMIARLLSPSIASTRFSANQLPEAVHGLALWNIMTPTVNSKSMAPTLRIGDELVLEQADNLQVGDVVVYRHDRLFICHRIHRIENHRLFLRGDANTGPFEEVDIRQAVGRVGFLLRHGQRIAVPPYKRSQKSSADDSIWARASTRGVGPGRFLSRRFLNWVARQPGVESIVRHILRTLITIEIMERASLHSLEGYVVRQRVHLNRLADSQQYLSPLNRNGIVFVVRAGPVFLGTGTLNPWHINMRPLFHSLTTEVLSESVGVFLPTQPPFMPSSTQQR